MKQLIKNIFLGIFVIAAFSFTYIKLFKASPAGVAVVLAVICLYGVCMGICEESMKQLKKYEIMQMRVGLTKKQLSLVLLFSLLSLSPTYFCVLLVSAIPLFTYEVWFVTIFPCLIFISMPMLSVLEEYYVLTKKKGPFLALFAGIVIFLMGAGIAGAAYVMNQLQ